MQITLEGLMYDIKSILFSKYLSGYKVYVSFMFVHVLYHSFKAVRYSFEMY